MDCLEVRFKIIRFLFGELSIVELAELHAHLRECLQQGCLECDKEWEATEILLSHLRAVGEAEPVPEGLRERIFAKLAEDL